MPSPTIPLSKPGKHGTLHLFRVTWTDCPLDVREGAAPDVAHRYAYDAEHARELVYESLDDDACEVFSVTRVRA